MITHDMHLSDPDPGIRKDITQSQQTIYVAMCSFTLLVWDQLSTLSSEIKYVWRGSKGPLSYLFLLNRYLTPFGFMVNLTAYLSPRFTEPVCKRFIKFEGSMTMIGISVASIMMLIRVFAMYPRNLVVLWVVFVLLIVHVSVNAWLLTKAQPVPHIQGSGVHSCTGTLRGYTTLLSVLVLTSC